MPNQIPTQQLKNLVGEAANVSEIIKIIEQLNVDNIDDFQMVKGGLNTLERIYEKGQLTPGEYQAQLQQKREGLLYFIGRYLKDKNKAQPNTRSRILFVAASPLNADCLQTDVEYKSIKGAIAASVFREKYELLDPIMAAGVEDVVQQLSSTNPQFAHFAGHAGKRGILLSNDENNGQVVGPEPLSIIFSNFPSIKCVFFNACYSALHAEAVGKYVKYVICMNSTIIDQTAIMFSNAFYIALCNSEDQSIEKCFHLARAVLMVKRTAEVQVPEMWIEGKKVTK